MNGRMDGQVACLLYFLMSEVYDSTTRMGCVRRTWLALALGRQETYGTRSSGPSIAMGISGVRMVILRMHVHQYGEVPTYLKHFIMCICPCSARSGAEKRDWPSPVCESSSSHKPCGVKAPSPAVTLAGCGDVASATCTVVKKGKFGFGCKWRFGFLDPDGLKQRRFRYFGRSAAAVSRETGNQTKRKANLSESAPRGRGAVLDCWHDACPKPSNQVAPASMIRRCPLVLPSTTCPSATLLMGDY